MPKSFFQNAAQADARLGRNYVKRLTRDLVEDVSVLNNEIAYYADVLKSVQQTDALLGESDPDPRALVVNAYRATEVSFTAPVRATWDEIVSGGHLDLLPQGVIESGLAQYYAYDIAQDVYRAGVDSDYRRSVRRIIPMNIQIEMRASCSDVRDATGNIVGFVEDCAFKADPAVLKETAAALKNDPAVAADLRLQYSVAVSATLNLDGTRKVLEFAQDLRSYLEFHDKLYDSAIARIAAVDYIYDKAFDRKLPDVLRLSVETWKVPETPPLSDQDLDVIMGSVNLIRITVGSRNGYESLISSGHLGLIENRDLARRVIVAFMDGH